MQAAKPPVSRSHRKFVTRTASILLRAKALILSDSESDDLQSSESSGRTCRAARKKVKHNRRSKASGDAFLSMSHEHLAGPSTNTSTPLYGKRKRCSTMTFTSSSGEHPISCKSMAHTRTADSQKMDTSCSPSGKACFVDCMELDQDDTSSLSDTSVECGGPNYDEADDEQSDFPHHEVMDKNKLNTLLPSSSPTRLVVSQRSQHQSRSSRSGAAPVLRNPFASISASSSDRMERTSSIGSSSLWKKRRRSLLPEKCVTSL